MKRLTFHALFAALSALGLLSCQPLATPPCTICPGTFKPEPEGPNACEPPIVVGRIVPGEAPDAIWLAQAPSNFCPQVSSKSGEWLVRELFVDGERAVCQYIWRPKDNERPDDAALREAGLTVQVDPPAISGLGGAHPEDQKWFEPLTELARARFDIPKNVPSPGPSPHGVQVAVLDTANTLGTGEVVDKDGHGTAMGAVVKMLGCADAGSCNVDVKYYPALSFAASGSNLTLPPTGSGDKGTAGELAAMIRKATNDWKDHKQSPLIINLSLGWSGCFEEPDGLRSVTVKNAITYATCHGALVLAAGGNTDVIDGCPKSAARGAEPLHMYPGLWGGETITKESCEKVKAPPPDEVTPASPMGAMEPPRPKAIPLLLGIGAVDYADNPLSITDHDSDLAAYGQAVPIASSHWPHDYRLYIGTSVSTAAVSGIAATALRYQPGLDLRGLIEKLYAARVPLFPSLAPRGKFICNRPDVTDCKQRIVSRLSVCQLLNALGAKVDCHVLGAGVSTSSDALNKLMGEQQSKSEPQPAECLQHCGEAGQPACASGCSFASGSGDEDACDAPWTQKQGKGGNAGCTCKAIVPTGMSTAARSLIAQVVSNGNSGRVTVGARFEVDATELKLVVNTRLGERRFVLGDLLKNRERYWSVNVVSPLNARIEYRVADEQDQSLGVTDVMVIPAETLAGRDLIQQGGVSAAGAASTAVTPTTPPKVESQVH